MARLTTQLGRDTNYEQIVHAEAAIATAPHLPGRSALCAAGWLLGHAQNHGDGGIGEQDELGEALDGYLTTLAPHWRRLLGADTLVDIAHTVVGVGSVELRA